MVNILLVLGHPERQSFNGGLVDTAVSVLESQGHQVQLDDLCGKGFDPVERPANFPDRAEEAPFAPLTEQRAHFKAGQLQKDVQQELELLDWADLVIFQFPLWWHAQPAILKGWFDRVLVYGGRYTGSMRYDRGYFRGKKAMLSVTTGSPREAFEPFGRAGNMVHWLWPMHASLYYVGFDVLAPQVSYGVQGGGIQYQGQAAFEQALDARKSDWASRLETILEETAIPFTGWDDWDKSGRLKHNHPMRWHAGN